MAGLLDFMQSDDARLGIGLLAAAGPSTMGFGERLQSVMSGMDAHKANQAKSKYYDMQYQTGLLGLDKAKREAENERGMAELARQFYTPATPGMGLLEGAIPSEFQTGAAPVPAKPASFNIDGFMDAAMGRNYMTPLDAAKLRASMAKEDAPQTVAPGASLVTRSGKVIYTAPTAPKEQELPSSVREFEYAQKVPGFGQWLQSQTAAKAPKVSVDLNDPTAVAKAGMALQNDVRAAFKDHYTIADQYQAMQSASTNPSPQGDTALLYSFFKVLDPTSTVREGEIAMVEGNRSIPDRFKGYAQKLAGGGSLLPHERQDILEQARRQVEARVPRATSDLKAYRDNASRLKLDPELYAPDPYAGFKASTKPKAAATPLPPNPTAKNLTKGTVYATKLGNATWDGFKFNPVEQ